MNKNEHLFHLIKSLSPSEKRYFKLLSGFHRGSRKSNYLRLFNLIDRQEKYDERELLKMFRRDKRAARFSDVKQHLCSLILRSLRLFHADSTVNARLGNMIQEAEILYNRSLLRHCMKILSSAKKLAIAFEKFLPLMEIIAMEEDVARSMPDIRRIRKYLDEGFAGEMKIWEKYRFVRRLREKSTRMFTDLSSEGIFPAEKNGAGHAAVSLSFNRKQVQSMPFEARLSYYYICGTRAVAGGDMKAAYQYLSEQVRLWEQHPGQIRERPKRYISSLNNFLNVCMEGHHYVPVPGLLQKLRALPVKETDTRVRIFERSYNLEMQMYCQLGEFRQGISLLPEIERGLEAYKGKINKAKEVIFYFQAAGLFFGAGDYRRALQWNNRVLNNEDKDIRQDIKSCARVLELLIHYELGNDALVESRLKSEFRYLEKRKQHFAFEKIITAFLHKSMSYGVKEQGRVALMQKAKQKLLKLSHEAGEKHAMENFDFISWLESRIEKKTFTEIVRRKAIARNLYISNLFVSLY